MEITKREILFSVIIVAVMLIIGFFLNSGIEESNTKNNEVYYLATKIENENQFQYGLKTSVGDTLTYGEIIAASPVTMEKISGEYFYIEKVVEEYNRHTKTETYKDSNGKTRTRTKVYYSWDHEFTKTEKSDSFSFMGMTFSNPINNLPYERADLSKLAVDQSKVHMNYIYNDDYFFESVGDTREYYNIVPISFSGTLEAKLVDNKLENFSGNEDLTFHYNKDIEKTIKDIENVGNSWVIAFRIIWGMLTIGAVFVFYYFENKWLE